MDNIRDPRIQIPTNLNEVQKEMEQAVSDREKEIKQEMADHKKSLKEEVKGLKQEVDNRYTDYKDYKKDSGDPVSDEKVSTAKEASKVMKKNIELDYEETIDRIEEEGNRRLESLDNMMKDPDRDPVNPERNPFDDFPII